MEREDFADLARVARKLWNLTWRWRDDPRYEHTTLAVFLVQAWAFAHGRSVTWASVPRHWAGCRVGRPPSWPDQTTMSRRLRGEDFTAFSDAVGQALNAEFVGAAPTPPGLVVSIDGKALEVAPHSGDTQATFGHTRGGRIGRGYRLHVVWDARRPMPEAWEVRPLHVCETTVAAETLIPRLGGGGYLLGDNRYDSHTLYELALANNRQMIAPRRHPGRGLGHHPQSQARRRSIELLETPRQPLMNLGGRNGSPCRGFGLGLAALRRLLEQAFAQLCTRAGLLTHLPPWARRLHRVRQWVGMALLFNAVRLLRGPSWDYAHA